MAQCFVMDMFDLSDTKTPIFMEWDMSPLVKLIYLASHLQEYNHLPVLDQLVELDMRDTHTYEHVCTIK